MKKLGLDEATWTYRFKCEGRVYTLVKRNKCRDGAWWLATAIRGKRIVRSLDTNLAAVAETKAISQYIRQAKAGNTEAIEKSKLRDQYSPLSKVMAVYQELCIGKVDPNTVRQNINSLRLVVRRGLGKESMTDEAVGALSSAVLTGKLVSDFEDWMARAAVIQERDLESNKRSVAAYLRHAKSFFKETALPRYPEKGVKLPDLKGFMDRAVEPASKLVRLPPSDKLLEATFEGAMELRKTDRPAYIAWLLGLCSLRRGEIAQAKWTWLSELNGAQFIVLPSDMTKSGATRMVPIDPRVVGELEEFKAIRCRGLDADEESFILPSPNIGQGKPNCRLRAQNVFKRANEFMRACGWKTNHTLHEMRALYLMWVRDSFGLDSAQAVAGHSSSTTTQNSYVGLKGVKGVTITLPLQLGGG